MEDIIDKPRRKYNFSLSLMLLCVFSFTVGQLIPIYFSNDSFRNLYNFLIFILLVATISRTTFKFIYKPQKDNISLARLVSILVGFTAFVVFGLLTIGFAFSVRTESFVFYVQKDNSKVKIISRYINEGAFGGGTEPNNYQIVLYRPLSDFFNLQTSIDTTFIDKNEWLRSKD